MSIWYTLVLAVWRLIMIRHHASAVTLCTPQRCYLMIILGYGEDSGWGGVWRELGNNIFLLGRWLVSHYRRIFFLSFVIHSPFYPPSPPHLGQLDEN